VGIVSPKEHLILGDKLTAGDAIVLVESSGIHTNGLSMALQATATKLGFKTWTAGRVGQGPKQVIINPENITFAGGELAVR